MTQKDKTDWQAVKKEIIDEIRKDMRSKEVLRALDETTWRSSASTFFQHPAILVVLTFIVTSLLGTQITTAWQSKQRELDQKYGIIDLVNRSVSDNLTAAQDIVGLYQQEKDALNRAEIETERWTYWQQKSREWRVNSNVIPQRLKGNFKDPEVQAIFQKLSQTAFDLSLYIKDLKSDVDHHSWTLVDRDAFQEKLRDVLKGIRELRNLMGQIIDRMTSEVNLSWWQRSFSDPNRLGIPYRLLTTSSHVPNANA
jgi:hypothetical protein